MFRYPAPDENLRYENWDATVKYAESLYYKALDFEGNTRNQYLNQAEATLHQVPDAHPKKTMLMQRIRCAK